MTKLCKSCFSEEIIYKDLHSCLCQACFDKTEVFIFRQKINGSIRTTRGESKGQALWRVCHSRHEANNWEIYEAENQMKGGSNA